MNKNVNVDLELERFRKDPFDAALANIDKSDLSSEDLPLFTFPPPSDKELDLEASDNKHDHEVPTLHSTRREQGREGPDREEGSQSDEDGVLEGSAWKHSRRQGHSQRLTPPQGRTLPFVRASTGQL